MTIEEVKEYFVTYRNLMKKLGLSNNAYMFWRKMGYVPYHQQQVIEEMTEGRLKANIADRRKTGVKPDKDRPGEKIRCVKLV